jgi:hypothetical protein
MRVGTYINLLYDDAEERIRELYSLQCFWNFKEIAHHRYRVHESHFRKHTRERLLALAQSQLARVNKLRG